MPGDTTGAGAVVVGHSNANGIIGSFTLQNGGVRYRYPPMISARGAWVHNDGVHPSGRGYDQMIASTGLGPDVFVL